MDELYQELSPIVNQFAFEEFESEFVKMEETEDFTSHSKFKNVKLYVKGNQALQVTLSVGKLTKNENEVLLAIQFVEDEINGTIVDMALFVSYIEIVDKVKYIIDSIIDEINVKLTEMQSDIRLDGSHINKKIELVKHMTDEEKEAAHEKHRVLFV